MNLGKIVREWEEPQEDFTIPDIIPNIIPVPEKEEKLISE